GIERSEKERSQLLRHTSCDALTGAAMVKDGSGAADVGQFVGVDDHAFTGCDEWRNEDADTVFKHSRLVGRSGGLALNDRIGFSDGERDLIRQADADRLFFVKFD